LAAIPSVKAGRPKGSANKLGPFAGPGDDAPVMTVTETCDYLRIGRTTLYRMIQRGDIPHFRIGSNYRFNREAIEEWMKNRGSPR
jgi:excisionase family DNA binding protein